MGVACITDKIREARLRWYGDYGHVTRRGDENSMKIIMTAEVNGRRAVEDDRRSDGET